MTAPMTKLSSRPMSTATTETRAMKPMRPRMMSARDSGMQARNPSQPLRSSSATTLTEVDTAIETATVGQITLTVPVGRLTARAMMAEMSSCVLSICLQVMKSDHMTAFTAGLPSCRG